ncbi:MAG TPA: peptide-methionine (S)-S-oxide reductase MsrA [Gemmatimonadaceae bacterium]|nr:peptide-methionine (S)-S-oxide reductase MsrA [Gemmatimonadaceae bacterium]
MALSLPVHLPGTHLAAFHVMTDPTTNPTPTPTPTRTPASHLDTATLGGGCFWCTEAVMNDVRGVERVASGYAGGHVPDPTYEQVCTGATGHAEVVQVTFDPAVVSYRDLLRIFFATHDPTTPNRQGADVGPQYRSIIFTNSDEQRRVAEEVIAELEREGVWDAPIVTQVEPLTTFYPAETYHTRYYERNPRQPYCQVVIAPKVAKLRRSFAEMLKSRV